MHSFIELFFCVSNVNALRRLGDIILHVIHNTIVCPSVITQRRCDCSIHPSIIAEQPETVGGGPVRPRSMGLQKKKDREKEKAWKLKTC